MVPTLVLFVGVGCFLDRSALVPEVLEEIYQCGATIVNAAGDLEIVSSTDILSPFFTSLLTHSACSDFGYADQVEDHWRRFIQSVVTTDPELVARGPWDCATISCEPVGPAPTPPTCPAALTNPPLADCASAPGCITLMPPDETPGSDFEGLLDFGQVDVGAAGIAPAMEVRNNCTVPVRVQIDGAIAGRNTEDYRFAVNGCAPRSTVEEEEGRELTAAGTPDATCSLSFEFHPVANGARGARSRFTQDMSEQYDIALRGLGYGGLVDVPGTLCIGALTGPRPECGGADGAAADLRLSHVDGPTVVIETVATEGNFRVPAGSTPLTIGPGVSMALSMTWCLPAPGADGNDTGTLTITSNGRNNSDGTILVDLEHLARGCP